VFADPGEQDLTSHVDFEAVERAARSGGAEVTPVVGQGQWLKRLGIEQRAASLARSNPERLDEVEAALQRLVAPDQMGELFKVLAIHAPDWKPPAGFA
jgi:SAM-dependent MidA family methyltransferase